MKKNNQIRYYIFFFFASLMANHVYIGLTRFLCHFRRLLQLQLHRTIDSIHSQSAEFLYIAEDNKRGNLINQMESMDPRNQIYRVDSVVQIQTQIPKMVGVFLTFDSSSVF